MRTGITRKKDHLNVDFWFLARAQFLGSHRAEHGSTLAAPNPVIMTLLQAACTHPQPRPVQTHALEQTPRAVAEQIPRAGLRIEMDKFSGYFGERIVE